MLPHETVEIQGAKKFTVHNMMGASWRNIDHMYFRYDQKGQTLTNLNRPSMYRTLDKLLRGEIPPEDLPALDEIKSDRKLSCLSNRRLTGLKMFQATEQ